MSCRAIAAFVIVAGLVPLGCSRSRPVAALAPAIPVTPGAAKGFNIALITLDTLRADRVGCYGYDRVRTPALDGLAAAGVRFVDAVTPVPITLPAHCTILTGKYPPGHGVRDNGTYRLLAEHQTLAEHLQTEGYATAAFLAAFVLDARYGLDQGFDVYDDDFTVRSTVPGKRRGVPQRPGDAVVDSALRWLDGHRSAEANQPFFLWIHLFDPHLPHDPPEPFRTEYASNLYDGEVAFADAQVGRFVDRLRELELQDNTLILVVGDHGEGLGDHGENTHSLLMYESTMRVPLILWGPPVIPQGRVVDDRLVATVDLVPTLLDLIGLELPDCDGTSLLRATENTDRAIYMETLAPELNHGWSPLFGLRRHHDKYIEAPTPEYFDLLEDPQERNNLAAKRSGSAAELRQRLSTLMAAFPAATTAARAAPDEQALQNLRALGYVGGNASAPAGTRFDPKDMVTAWERKITQADKLVAQGDFRKSIPLLEELLRITRHDPGVWMLLSEAQAQARQLEQAIESRMQAIELQPTDPDNWVKVASLQYFTGDMEAARISLDQAERLQPNHGEIYLWRGEFARVAGDYEKAIELCEESRRRDPVRYTAPAWSFQGRLYEAMGQLDQAASAYQQAYEADPLDSGTLFGMAGLALREGRWKRVVELTGKIVPSAPEWVLSQKLLAQAYIGLEQRDVAARLVRKLAAVLPEDTEVREMLRTLEENTESPK